MKPLRHVHRISFVACAAALVACGSADTDPRANGSALGAGAVDSPELPPTSGDDSAPAWEPSPDGDHLSSTDSGSGAEAGPADAGADGDPDAGTDPDAAADPDAGGSDASGPDAAAPPSATAPPAGWSGKTFTMDVSCTFTTTVTTSSGSTVTVSTYDDLVTMALYANSPGTTTLSLPGSGVVTRPMSRLSLKTVPLATHPSSMSWWKSDFDRCGSSYGKCPSRTGRETLRTLAEYTASGKELADEVSVTLGDTTNDPLLAYMKRSRTVSVKATADGGLSMSFTGSASNRGLSITAPSYSYRTTCGGSWHP